MKDLTMKEISAVFKKKHYVWNIVSIPMPSYIYVASAIGKKKGKICILKEISISAAI
jgi:hypothetical protein